MLSPKIANGIASFVVNSTRKLTPRQVTTYNQTNDRYGERAAERYLYSLLRLTKGRVDVKRLKAPSYVNDKLAIKSKNEVLTQFKALLNCDDETSHIPSNRHIGKWIGVEIECFYPAEREYSNCSCDDGCCECEPEYCPDRDTAHKRLRRLIQAANIPRASVKDDGSLHDDEGVGVEITLLFNSADGFEPLNKLCKVLHDAGCYVNKTCGLHVHLDARHLKNKGVKLIGRRLGRALPVLKWIVDPSRHNNTFCQMDVSRFTSTHSSRYFAINLTAFFRYKTIEIRMHGGSTNARKIRSWIELLQFLSNQKIPKNFKTFQQLIDLGTPSHLIEYADKRITRLNPEAWPILIPPPISEPAMPVARFVEVDGVATSLEIVDPIDMNNARHGR